MTELLKEIPLVRILFVCMGNICRSPAAEVILHDLVDKAGLADKVEVDSAGTIGYHQGQPLDKRMYKALIRRGYSAFGHARRILSDDLFKFDLILTMDEENLREVKSLDRQGVFATKIKKMSDFFHRHKDSEVPDPYYGGNSGFDYVIDLLEDGCQNLLTEIKKKVNFPEDTPPRSSSS